MLKNSQTFSQFMWQGIVRDFLLFSRFFSFQGGLVPSLDLGSGAFPLFVNTFESDLHRSEMLSSLLVPLQLIPFPNGPENVRVGLYISLKFPFPVNHALWFYSEMLFLHHSCRNERLLSSLSFSNRILQWFGLVQSSVVPPQQTSPFLFLDNKSNGSSQKNAQ